MVGDGIGYLVHIDPKIFIHETLPYINATKKKRHTKNQLLRAILLRHPRGATFTADGRCRSIYISPLQIELDRQFSTERSYNVATPLEKQVAHTISHEVMHLLLRKTVNSAASKAWDNIAIGLKEAGFGV